MSERIYSFEPYEDFWHGSGGEIYRAWDRSTETMVWVYAWDAPSEHFDDLMDAYKRLRTSLGPKVETFTSAKRLYFAVPDLPTGDSAMQTLKPAGLFVGLPILKDGRKPEVAVLAVAESKVGVPTVSGNPERTADPVIDHTPPRRTEIQQAVPQQEHKRPLAVTVGVALGMILYVSSFSLVVFGGSSSPIRGWFCAYLALVAPVHDFWRGGARDSQSGSLFISGLANPVFILAMGLWVWRRRLKSAAILSTFALAMHATCWIVFTKKDGIGLPREGYYFWAAGMLIATLSMIAPRLFGSPLD